MLLMITYNGEQADRLGFLLHKNPKRPQVFSLNYGNAYVFYPQVSENSCTAALLLEIDPLDLARGKVGSRDGGLFDYVNDRPYVSSSFMSSAISRVYGTAMSGRCDKQQALADSALDLSAEVVMLPCRGDLAMLERVFTPLGYTVRYETSVLDESFPQWGESRYVNLTIKANVRLCMLLRHLYVLIPVFDRQKHYWMNHDEIDKLLIHGKGWLETHPEKEFITKRYMGYKRSFARIALDRMDDGEAGTVMEETETETERPASLNQQRLSAVVEALKAAGAESVIDLGCGEGNLLLLLLKERTFKKIAGMDVAPQVLDRAAHRLRLDRMGDAQRERIALFQGSLMYKDKRLYGYDAACVVEVIEHMDKGRLAAFEQVLFGETQPKTVILTTPNIEYNKAYEGLSPNALRHSDHRFEWTRKEFEKWCGRVAAKHGYSVICSAIGEAHEELGAPTQMGVFTKCE